MFVLYSAQRPFAPCHHGACAIEISVRRPVVVASPHAEHAKARECGSARG
jgi:hypothetical protein